MTDRTHIDVQARNIFGNQVKQLRKDGILPANIYGAQIESLAVEVPEIDLKRLVKTIGESEVIDIQVQGEDGTRPVLIGAVQKDPVTNDLMHVDFRQIDLLKEVTVEVEIIFEGEAPATKVANTVLLELMDVIEVTALPTKLPSQIIVDISGLAEVNDAITVADLALPEGVVPSADADQLVCKIDVVRVQEELEEAEEEGTQESAEETPEESPEESKQTEEA